MTTTDLVADLAQDLDTRQARIATDQRYLDGTQPLAFLSNIARDATKLSRMASNIPAVQVNAIAERLRVTGLVGGDRADFVRNDLDQNLPVAFREALGVGSSYAIVWDSTGQRRPVASVESAEQVIVRRDPASREITSALKRVSVGSTTRAWLYLPDAVVPFTADGENAALGWRQGQAIRNPLGVVPVVEFRNATRLLGPGVSEIEDLKPLVDALNKLLADMMVGSEFYARPRRWASGIEMQSDDEGNPVNPFPEGDRMMVSEESEAKFGQLSAADLGSYEKAVGVVLGQIMAVSALPAHYLGALTGQAPGADGLRAAEAALTARAEAKQGLFGRSVEQMGRLMEAVRTDSDPRNIEVKVTWADAGTRSIAQESDAVVKLHQAGLLPADYALARLGYDADELKAIRASRAAEAASRVTLQPAAPVGATA